MNKKPLKLQSVAVTVAATVAQTLATTTAQTSSGGPSFIVLYHGRVRKQKYGL